MSTRRLFLGSAAASALFAAVGDVLSEREFAALAQDLGKQDQSVINFWTEEVKAPYASFQKGLGLKGGPSYQPAFAFYAGPGNFLASSDIPTSDLPAKGQMNVSFRVERFRPSDATKAMFANSQSGSLRVDVKQTTPLPSLQQALAWTAVAGLVPKDKNPFPDLSNLSFDTGTAWGELQKVPLSNGLGFWAWNFFLTKKESMWGKVMDVFRSADKAAPLFFPLLGLPAIALTALTAVDKLVGYLQAQDNSTWLFKSVDSPVFATLEGKTAIGQGLPLKTGHYLVMPQDHIGDFGSARKNLDLIDGCLVPVGTDSFKVFDVAATQIPAVDYLSLYVQATPDTAQTKPAA